MNALRILLAALFLLQQSLGAAELCHHDEGGCDHGVPSICHTCTDEGPCSEDHHHHRAHDHTLCPSCVHLFVHLPQPESILTISITPDRISVIESASVPSSLESTILRCRAPPCGPSL